MAEYEEANVRHIVCPKCRGAGVIWPYTGENVCPICMGKGWVHKRLGPHDIIKIGCMQDDVQEN